MLKKLASMLLPSDAKIAAKAAGSIQGAVNGSAEDKKAIIAKYACLANEFATIGANLSDMLKNGDIDDMERETLAGLIKPLVTKAREVIGV